MASFLSSAAQCLWMFMASLQTLENSFEGEILRDGTSLGQASGRLGAGEIWVLMLLLSLF